MAAKSAPKTRKCAASNVAGAVTAKRAQKTRQPAHPEDPELVGGDQGEEEEGVEKEQLGKGKQGGRGRGGKAVGKGRGQGGR